MESNKMNTTYKGCQVKKKETLKSLEKHTFWGLFLAGLIIFSTQIFAQSGQVKNLAQQITAGKNTDSLKVRAIYEWVAKNIDYDVPMLTKMHRKSVEEFIAMQQPSQVLANKKAVCMGYSILFKELCSAVGIQAEFVTGISKYYDPYTKKHTIPDDLHAWNAVKVNGKWYLTDLTWSAGSVSQEDGKYYKKFNEEYYLTRKNDFAKTHLPFDPIWQLTNQPLTTREFKLYPELPPSRMNPPTINYLDSLRVYERQDSTTRKLASYRRALKFDSSNDEAKAALGYYYSQRALDGYEEFMKITSKYNIVKSADDAKRVLETRPRVFEILKESEANFRMSRYYYVQIPSNSKFSFVAESNKEVVAKNQDLINQNRSRLGDFYKSLEANLKKMR